MGKRINVFHHGFESFGVVHKCVSTRAGKCSCQCKHRAVLAAAHNFHHCQHLTKYVKKCMNLAAGAWHKTIAGKLENACVVLISQPAASNCRDYCIKRGGHCVRAQDNKGYNQVWFNQVCACGRGKVSSNGGGDSAKYTSSEGNNVNRNGYLKL